MSDKKFEFGKNREMFDAQGRTTLSLEEVRRKGLERLAAGGNRLAQSVLGIQLNEIPPSADANMEARVEGLRTDFHRELERETRQRIDRMRQLVNPFD